MAVAQAMPLATLLTEEHTPSPHFINNTIDVSTHLCALALGAGAAEHLGDLGKLDGLAIHDGEAADAERRKCYQPH